MEKDLEEKGEKKYIRTEQSHKDRNFQGNRYSCSLDKFKYSLLFIFPRNLLCSYMNQRLLITLYV